MDNLEKDVREQLDKHGSVLKACRSLGIKNVEYVADIQAKMAKDTKPELARCDYDGFGRPDIRENLVARNLATESWDNSRPEVADARDKFEAGTHNLLTGRDGPYILLYAFPQPVVTPRPDYFSPTFEA